jgi:hypothetical protein
MDSSSAFFSSVVFAPAPASSVTATAVAVSCSCDASVSGASVTTCCSAALFFFVLLRFFVLVFARALAIFTPFSFAGILMIPQNSLIITA